MDKPKKSLPMNRKQGLLLLRKLALEYYEKNCTDSPQGLALASTAFRQSFVPDILPAVEPTSLLLGCSSYIIITSHDIKNQGLELW
ncbi:hypothetical protein [Dulcicalothrix desertica]|uniref:hypothetical protein n=1 Tax=Dulcicalothrix desertica TaxID=32056 RepID=UPI000F8F3B21|nr:hypothetical protein [Dulcicalothrix desertica]TWH39024.1 hypothetical protein CAL7102_08228 [Dulcicalothrix desertica PCC 7102]